MENKRGFSFIETIFSVFILSVGIMGVMALLTGGLRDSMDSRDQLIAAGLAQEGIELVRNVRDNNWLQIPSSVSFDYFPDSLNENCRIDKDYVKSTEIECDQVENDFVLYNDGYFYAHASTSEATKFKRKIMLDSNSDPDSIEAYSIVTWGGNIDPFDMSNVDSACNTASKCTFTRTTLKKWGERVFSP